MEHYYDPACFCINCVSYERRLQAAIRRDTQKMQEIKTGFALQRSALEQVQIRVKPKPLRIRGV